MKNNLLKTLLFLFFLGFTQFANSQFYDATLELSNGKILQGGAKPTFRSFIFKENGQNNEVTFKPEEVKQLIIHDKRYPADTLKYRFESKKVGKEPWLLTIFIDGYVSLYARISKAQPGYDIYYLLKKQGDEIVRDVNFTSSAGDLIFPELKSLTEEDLKYFFRDYPDLIISGKLNEKLRKESLADFMIEYNKLKSKKSK